MKRILYILVLTFISASLRAQEPSDSAVKAADNFLLKLAQDLADGEAFSDGLDARRSANVPDIGFIVNKELLNFFKRFTEQTGIGIGLKGSVLTDNMIWKCFNVTNYKGTYKEGSGLLFNLEFIPNFEKGSETDRPYFIKIELDMEKVRPLVTENNGISPEKWGGFWEYLKDVNDKTTLYRRDDFKDSVNKIISGGLSILLGIRFEDVMASTTMITKLPTYIGYAHSYAKGYLCNVAKIEETDGILNKLSEKLFNDDIIESCDIIVKRNVEIGWYNAEKKGDVIDLNDNKKSEESFYIKFTNKERIKIVKRIIISEDDLSDDDDDNICELIVENNQTKQSTTIARFHLRKYDARESQRYYAIQVERSIQGNPNRIDYYMDRTTIATNSDVPVKVGSVLMFNVVQKRNDEDAIQISNDNTKWYVQDRLQYTGQQFDYTVLEGSIPVKAVLDEESTILINVDPEAEDTPDGRVRLDNRALTNDTDKSKAATYFGTAFSTTRPRILRRDLLNFINGAPKEIVVKVINNPPIGGKLRGGEASDGAVAIGNGYDALDLTSITKDANNAIINAQLISRLNSDDKRSINASVNIGYLNQKTEVLLYRIARLSNQQKDILKTMIEQKTIRSEFLDSVRYEITAEDDVKEWMTFHNNSTIEAMVNLNNGFGGRIEQDDFIRLTAHELLHHWWTHTKPFDRLKWKVIRSLAEEKGYILSDGLGNNGACSEKDGHERHNPENKTVCREQNNY